MFHKSSFVPKTNEKKKSKVSKFMELHKNWGKWEHIKAQHIRCCSCHQSMPKLKPTAATSKLILYLRYQNTQLQCLLTSTLKTRSDTTYLYSMRTCVQVRTLSTIIVLFSRQKFTQLVLKVIGLHTQPSTKKGICDVLYLWHFMNKENVSAYGFSSIFQLKLWNKI